jgi:hypothetical protein
MGLAGGCLERKETIRVAPDGGVHVEIQYSGEPEQMETADALPSDASGWPVRRDVELDKDGKEVVTLTAERRFQPREDLPRNFAPKDDPDADLYLQFPTSVQIERRDDGLYMHFRRTYLPRAWANIQYWQDQIIDDDIKKRADKPVEEMSEEDRVMIVKAFAGFEFYKQLELLSVAMRRLGAEVPQDVWLRARAALLETAEATDWDAVVARVVGLPEDQRDKAFEAESQKLLEGTHRAFAAELAAAGKFSELQMERFEAAFTRAKKEHQITHELSAHAFKTTVFMPGEVVAHNADKIDDDGAAEWEFGGDAFRDRPFEMMITSKLPGDGGR